MNQASSIAPRSPLNFGDKDFLKKATETTPEPQLRYNNSIHEQIGPNVNIDIDELKENDDQNSSTHDKITHSPVDARITEARHQGLSPFNERVDKGDELVQKVDISLDSFNKNHLFQSSNRVSRVTNMQP